MLPDVAGQKRGLAMAHGGVGVGGLGDLDGPLLGDEPGPAAAELGDAGVLELFLELVERAERGVDGGRDIVRGLAAAARFHAVPVKRVVPDLRGVVEHAGLRRVARHRLFKLKTAKRRV